MATTGPGVVTAAPHAGQKRSRADVEPEDEGVARGRGYEKKARPTSGDHSIWQRDSVISTPSVSQPSLQHPKYDSDDQSSMMSEPGSPQDISMSSDDDMQDDGLMPAFSHSPESHLTSSSSRTPFRSSSPWHARTLQNHGQRIPTPSIPHQSRPGIRPIQLNTAIQSQHVRARHPQENLSSDGHLEVPSPIDEDEVPTPPSAAEAAGSQLSMLTVSDMDITPLPGPDLPTINVSNQAATQTPAHMGSAIDADASMDETPHLTVRKPRQRSGAVSSGHGGSPSPVRDMAGQKRGFSMGFRADCEKCRLRVPGHMNHLVTT